MVYGAAAAAVNSNGSAAPNSGVVVGNPNSNSTFTELQTAAIFTQLPPIETLGTAAQQSKCIFQPYFKT